ncbi:MAG: hypothetical protein EPN14_05620 [Gallionella sp.]|nr:MAG: hypothetical protein EPN14_05620 [Gallionella sp.]
MCLCWGVHTPVYAGAEHGEARGELLYSTHCGACHSGQIHWREKKLAADWDSLAAQVRRWQANIGLAWNEEEIEDTAHYLNAAYYHFPTAGAKGSPGNY